MRSSLRSSIEDSTLKMDMHSDYTEPVTPGISYNGAGYWRAEDSGYHSFTPGSFESSEISDSSKLAQRKICFTGQIHVDCRSVTPEENYRSRKYATSSSILRSCENFVESPVIRRCLKRSYQEDDSDNIFSPFPTPTSVIAGSLRELKFNDGNKLSTSLTFSNRGHTDVPSDLYYRSDHIHTSYPTTPIKKICRSSCKLSSPLNLRKPSKKLNFVIHSLSCETQALQPIVPPVRSEPLPTQSKFRPDQKVDIIKMLYHEAHVMPPIMKIFSYLSNKDIYNFTLVSQLWSQVWEDVSKIKSKQTEYLKFLEDRKANQENKNSVPKNYESNPTKPLIEIHNLLTNNSQKNSPSSPPGTPRTIKFKKYVKSARLDIRMQLSCARCHQPAKVTEESSGEEWVECSSATCSYQFCRYCRCERHPGKTCTQYDLNGPSPSKRKKTACVVGTKKSRKNLRRLL
ncbi:uncharacterized protein Rca1 [Epargyreus clarus]|uniref:uncharacterized protein Rca1 n=1 Tax=Epargyreus clarus TaxID=520877 RepID=UPI003C2D7603